MRLSLAVIALGLSCALAPVAAGAGPPAPVRGQSMGMDWSLQLGRSGGRDIEALRDGVQAALDRVDAAMSTYRPDSALSRFNRAPAGTWQALPEGLYTVLAHALALARDSGGAFDPTVGPLVDLWGFGPVDEPHTPPSAAALAAARQRVGWWRIRLDPVRRRAWQPGGVALDLSAVAKGYAVDQAARWLLAQGMQHFLLEVGGELRAHGRNARGETWRIAIENPPATSDAPRARVLALHDAAIATSGDYRHFYRDGGRRYSHHIDPRSGQPVPAQVASVSVVAPRCVAADPIGTTLSVLGAQAGLAWAKQRGLAVRMLVRGADGKLHERMTPAFRRLLSP